MAFFKEELNRVKAFIFDIDGVLSNHAMEISEDGNLKRTSCAKDGYALMYACSKGYPVGIISGGKGPGIRARLEKLGVKDIYLHQSNKLEALEDFLKKNNLEAADIMYMGDDIPDYELMKIIGVPVCPADACPEIKSISAYVSDINGGNGCVRDVVEQVMKAQDKWMDTACHVKSM
jgi:3-deoxy-D-manno-octulosonate 8-phosphate phosphatase (KDO 8-P phosphatase)